MRLTQVAVDATVTNLIETGYYDGIPSLPYEAVTCPTCACPAAIVDTYLGGFGRHKRVCCLAHPEHSAPVVRNNGDWHTAAYVRGQFGHYIIPHSTIVPENAKNVTIFTEDDR